MQDLEGILVVSLEQAVAAPLATSRMADAGARVIKVERAEGDFARGYDRLVHGESAYFVWLNHGKESICLDLRAAEPLALLQRMIAAADVFVQNLAPGAATRLGVGPDAMRATNPRLIYVSISGYGEDGPYLNRPGQDLVLQGMSGAMLSAGREGEPPNAAGQYLVDAITAYTAFEGALAALLHRERTGEGQKVEVNMLDAITTIQMQELSVFTVGGKPQTRSAEPHAHVYIRAPYGAFATSDGFIIVAFPKLANLGNVIGEPSFLTMDDEVDTWSRRDEIFAKTRDRLKSKTSAEWLALLRAADIWCGPVYGYADLVEDEQIKHNGTFVEYDHPTEGHVKTPGFPIRFSKTPSTVEGVLENLIGKPGVFTWPSVGWSYSTKVPLCLICSSSTRSA